MPPRRHNCRWSLRPRRDSQDARNHVDGQRTSSLAAGNLGATGQSYIGRSFDVDPVAGLTTLDLRVNLLRMAECDDRLVLSVRHRGVQTTGHLAGLHRYERRFPQDPGNDRFAPFFNALDVPADGCSDQVNRLGKTDVSENRACFQSLLECLRAEPHALAGEHCRPVG